MSAQNEEPHDRIPGIKRKWRIRGDAVIGLWGMFAAWIAVEALWPPHRTEAVLWRASLALFMCAGACSSLIAWYLAREMVEPVNDERFVVRMAWRDGYAKGLADKQDRALHLIPAPQDAADARSSSNGRL